MTDDLPRRLSLAVPLEPLLLSLVGQHEYDCWRHARASIRALCEIEEVPFEYAVQDQPLRRLAYDALKMYILREISDEVFEELTKKMHYVVHLLKTKYDREENPKYNFHKKET